MTIFGTRPEAIKMCPLVLEMKKYPDMLEPIVAVTAQHREMLDQVLDLFQIKPDYDLNIMTAGQTLYDVTSRALMGLKEVLEQAQRPTKKGAIVMDTAGYDISSVTSMVAAGCQAVIFTTGRGTPTGNAIVPVLKVTANGRTYAWMEDNMDIDLSPIVRGEKTYQEMGREMVAAIEDICNGKMTKAEAYGFSDIAVDHVCRFV